MNIVKWLDFLAPRLSKIDVMKDIEITEKLLNTTVVPVYSEFIKSFVSTRKFASVELNNFEKMFYTESGFKAMKFKTFMNCIEDNIPNVISNLNETEHQIKILLEQDVLKSGLNCKQAVAIRAAEQIGFISNYMLDLMTYVYSIEAITILEKNKGATQDDIDLEKLPKIQLEFVEKNFFKFASYFGLYAVKPDQFKIRFSKSPEVHISTDEKVMSRLTSVWDMSVIDAITGGNSVAMSRFEYNPFYHFGKMYACWLDDRYNLWKEKRSQVQIRLLHLTTLDEGKIDPKQQKEIDYLTIRIDDLSHKIKVYEDSLDDGAY